MLFENVVKPGVLNEKSDTVRTEKILNEELPPILDFLEKTLADDRSWIGDTKVISLADISIVSHLATLDTANLSATKLIGPNRPHLLAYFQKIIDRDAFKKALQL